MVTRNSSPTKYQDCRIHSELQVSPTGIVIRVTTQFDRKNSRPTLNTKAGRLTRAWETSFTLITVDTGEMQENDPQ